ncbi:hypothetical protein CC2G_001823 [Coprinopsis cinerea AmutBmut pab1-1]|nr:hypothetical protein CC2G_001823 [Coprinopsis cinerea AmutBmut pab1-1]
MSTSAFHFVTPMPTTTKQSNPPAQSDAHLPDQPTVSNHSTTSDNMNHAVALGLWIAARRSHEESKKEGDGHIQHSSWRKVHPMLWRLGVISAVPLAILGAASRRDWWIFVVLLVAAM